MSKLTHEERLQAYKDKQAAKHAYSIAPNFNNVLRKAAKRQRSERIASRAEQHSRYIDCGPGNWDDR